MIVRGRVVIPIVLAALMQNGLAPSAHALFHKKKNTSPYAYLAPKKQKKSKSWYRSSLTGDMVYGKPPKQQKKKKK